MTILGTITGECVFGFLGDVFGREKIILLPLLFELVFTILSAVAVPVDGKFSAIFVWISVSRFFMGFGAGGECLHFLYILLNFDF